MKTEDVMLLTPYQQDVLLMLKAMLAQQVETNDLLKTIIAMGDE